jgi:hypothetical protein
LPRGNPRPAAAILHGATAVAETWNCTDEDSGGSSVDLSSSRLDSMRSGTEAANVRADAATTAIGTLAHASLRGFLLPVDREFMRFPAAPSSIGHRDHDRVGIRAGRMILPGPDTPGYGI